MQRGRTVRPSRPRESTSFAERSPVGFAAEASPRHTRGCLNVGCAWSRFADTGTEPEDNYPVRGRIAGHSRLDTVRIYAQAGRGGG